MAKEVVVFDGRVVETLQGAEFLVETYRDIRDESTKTGLSAKCTLAGKLRMNSIKIILGDAVRVELSVYDLTIGRINYRYRDSELTQRRSEEGSTSFAPSQNHKKNRKNI